MKNLSIYIPGLALALAFSACGGSGGSDSVKDAKAANEAKVDSQKKRETPPDSSKIMVSKEAADFLVNAYSGGLAEVQLGSVAQTHSSNKDIKAFGAMMVRDHSDQGVRLKAVADSLHVTLPVTISTSQQKMITDLQKRSGKDFDKAYIARMVSDHQQDIDEFERQAKKGVPEVSAFANSSLPMLHKHLDSAQNLRKLLGFKEITAPPPPYQ
jgi:putative membrane protein